MRKTVVLKAATLAATLTAVGTATAYPNTSGVHFSDANLANACFIRKGNVFHVGSGIYSNPAAVAKLATQYGLKASDAKSWLSFDGEDECGQVDPVFATSEEGFAKMGW
ncbi:hypothetical protein [Mycobacterium sp. SMC-19]|uniref:hypothetical protein n=1 Tax=Mycobacterium sp. SMC-19 TaxID=3381630 RepID=UPI00387717A4